MFGNVIFKTILQMRKFIWLPNFQKQFWRQEKFKKKIPDFFCGKKFRFQIKTIYEFFPEKKFLIFFCERSWFFLEKKLSNLFREKISISDKYNFGVFSKKKVLIFFCEKSSDILFGKKVPDFYREKNFNYFSISDFFAKNSFGFK
jgi:hypothetical protein